MHEDLCMEYGSEWYQKLESPELHVPSRYSKRVVLIECIQVASLKTTFVLTHVKQTPPIVGYSVGGTTRN